MDEMSSYRRNQQKAARAHLGLLPQTESAGRTAEGRRPAGGPGRRGGGRATALPVSPGPGASVSLSPPLRKEGAGRISLRLALTSCDHGSEILGCCDSIIFRVGGIGFFQK